MQEIESAIPERGNCFMRACVARMVLSHVSSKWGSLIVQALMLSGVLRFSELRDRIEGISEKVLSQKLRELERDGLILRTMYPVVPPRVEYRLSRLGIGAAEHVKALVLWIENNVRDLSGAQNAYDESEPLPE